MAVNRRLRALAAAGETSVVSAYPDSFPQDLACMIHAEHLPLTRRARAGATRLAAFTVDSLVWAIRQRRRGVRYDIIYTIQDSSAAAGLVLRQPGSVWIVDVLDDPQLELRNAIERSSRGRAALLYARDRLFRWLVRRADVVATIGTSQRDPLPRLLRNRYRVPGRRVLPLPQSIDLRGVPRLPLPAATDPVRVFYVGWVSPLRGVDVLIDAMRLLRARGLTPQLRLAGYMKGPDVVWFEKVEQEFAPSVQYLGELTGQEVRREIAGALICVCPFPDRRELQPVQPVKVLEYLAAGRPIVASRLPGLQTLLEDDTNGILVRPGDANELADAIARVMSDRQLANRLAGSARARAEMFDSSEVDKVLIEALRSA